MKRAARLACLAAFVLLAVAACRPNVSDNGGPTGTPTPTGTGTPLPGNHITADTTWPTAFAMTGSMTVDPGVTLTIQSNSTISIAQSATLYVAGTLNVQGYVAGSAGTPTVFQPSASYWGSIDVVSGGVATIKNVRFTGDTTAIRTEPGALTSRLIKVIFDGGYPVAASADVKLCRAQLVNNADGIGGDAGTITIVDSNVSSGSYGDTTSLGGANFVMDHSVDGTTSGSSNHCLIHTGGSSSIVTVTSSVFNLGSYLLDLGAGSSSTKVTIHQSNIGSTSQITQGYDRFGNGTPTAVDASSNYWNGGTPPSNWTTAPVLPSAVATAGIRPYGQGCESDPTF